MQVRRGYLLPISILIALALSSGLSAQSTLILTDNRSKYDFTGSMKIVLDETNLMDREGMLPVLGAAGPMKTAEPNFGYIRGTAWGLVSIRNESELDDYLLYFGYNLGYIDLFVSRDGKPFSSNPDFSTGSMVPLSKKPYANRFSVIPLDLKKGVTYTLLLRINTRGSLSIPVYLYAPQAFNSFNEKANLFFGVMFGLLAGVILYILFIMLASRMWSLVHFLFFSFYHLIFQLGFCGYLNLYLLGEWPMAVLVIEDVAAALTLIAGIVFAQTFLNTRKNAPAAHSMLIAGIILGVASTVLVAVGRFKINVTLTNTVLLACSLLIAGSAVKIYINKYKPARFYTYAYAALCLSSLVFAAKNYTILPSTFLTNQSILIGFVVQGILLSLAIADTINFLKVENRSYRTQLSESRESEIASLKDKYYRDSMTGLKNRNRMILDLQRLEAGSLFIINTDDFRQINDLYGTIVGNKVLMEMGRRLARADIAAEHEVYRLHADEFAVVVPRRLEDGELLRIAERLVGHCQDDEYVMDGHRIPIAVTVGVSSGNSNILERADIALEFARRSRRDFAVFSPEIEAKQTLQTDLDRVHLVRYAIEHDTVFPVFQPIANNVSGAIEKYEMLMRIRGADGKVYAPGEFLQTAKKARLYPKLSRSLIRKGLAATRGAPFEFSINISVDDILNRESMEVIRQCMDMHPDPRNVVFEILESESIEAYKPVIGFIDEVKGKGCLIAIDDFGSGYSNFNHILNLNVDYLKLDASLIKTIDCNRNARAVAETISQFGKKLRIKTIAEFVHSKPVRDVVADIGIDYSQGYFIGEPGELIV